MNQRQFNIRRGKCELIGAKFQVTDMNQYVDNFTLASMKKKESDSLFLFCFLQALTS